MQDPMLILLQGSISTPKFRGIYMWFILFLFFIIENAGLIVLIVLALTSIGLIAQHIEAVCIVLGIISIILCSLCYSHITEYCFDKKIIGVLFAIASHIFFFLSLGLSGWLLFILIIVDYCALYGYIECEECEIMSILIALASLIIPAIIILIN